MKFIHQREHLNEDDIVVIQCSQMCNIRLMNDANFRSFKNGGRQYAGSPMPWEGLARMTSEDIGSLYEYLMAEPVSGEKAPTDPRVKH